MKVINFVKGCSPLMRQFLFFHDKAMVIVLFIAVFVGGTMIVVLRHKYKTKMFLEKDLLEFFWTFIPRIFLFFLALPSLKLLYYMDISNDGFTKFTIKSVGHQ